VRDGSGEAEVPRRRSEKDKECEVAVWLHRPHDDRCVSREGCEDFSKETGAALTCLPVHVRPVVSRLPSVSFYRYSTGTANLTRKIYPRTKYMYTSTRARCRWAA
jgi:hypothetical protein